VIIVGNTIELGTKADVLSANVTADLAASFNDVEAPVLELV
jgi:hypothetical protein